MIKFSILWVDDDFGDERTNLGFQLVQFRDQLITELRILGVDLIIEQRSNGLILENLASTHFDLILLDIELSSKNPLEPLSGFEVIERLKLFVIPPPVAILTRHLGDESDCYKNDLSSHKARYIRAFQKTSADITRLGKFIAEYSLNPPFTMVVLSDLHIGHIESKSENEGFQEVLLDEFRDLAQKTKIDYLAITGDFAWKNQSVDLPHAASFVNRLRDCLNVKNSEQFHFCPGNHDVSFQDNNPWEKYFSFVTRLSENDKSLEERFYSYYERGRTLQPFNDKKSTLAVAYGNKKKSVLFAALNSCKIIKKEDRIAVEPEVGTEQWNELRRIIENEPKDQLRIALLHHPLFSAPGGDFPDEKALLDQAQALHQFGKLGFKLILHGHSHFSAIYEHRVLALNDSPFSSSPVTKINVIACPTCGAEPSAAAPFRQYLILSISSFDNNTNSRTLNVKTRVYNHINKSWAEGVKLLDDSFKINF